MREYDGWQGEAQRIIFTLQKLGLEAPSFGDSRAKAYQKVADALEVLALRLKYETADQDGKDIDRKDIRPK